MQYTLFLPQMRLSMPDLVERARAAEDAGFGGIALMDHLSPPLAAGHPMFEAMTAATWLAATTERLRVGHLVLCDAFREPSVLASQVATIDQASGGRFELGIGWGSVPEELARFGVTDARPPERVARLGETLEVLRALWSGEVVDFAGDHHRLESVEQQPAPARPVPIVIGGAGPKTLQLVARHADWWNCPVYALDRFDELRHQVGDARPSVQEMVAFIPDESRRDEITQLAERRFAQMGDGLVIGNAEELGMHFEDLADRGVERVYAWMTDFAQPDALAQFGEQVIDAN
ncbi:MAG: LLM class flavin-dependent oxidoreductase [Acidimicrobiales bacterium]|nr:LLM class flavin-dependent oxidoreductase [Acidimicrobiales bacterium]